MKRPRTILLTSVMVLTVGLTVFSQGGPDTKRFNLGGLAFDYPSAWVLQDASSPEAQQLALGKADSEAQITIFAYRNHVTTAERVAEVKKVLVDPYISSTTKQLEQMAGKVERSDAAGEFAGVKTEGVKLRVVLDGEAGGAEIYWAIISQRLVVLTFVGPDRALKQASPVWDKIRSTMQVEAPKPASAPSPAPSPSPK
jgi:hypothetical protein